MDTDELALIKAIEETPEDALARSAYADWLESQGNHRKSQFFRTTAPIQNIKFHSGSCEVASYQITMEMWMQHGPQLAQLSSGLPIISDKSAGADVGGPELFTPYQGLSGIGNYRATDTRDLVGIWFFREEGAPVASGVIPNPAHSVPYAIINSLAALGNMQYRRSILWSYNGPAFAGRLYHPESVRCRDHANHQLSIASHLCALHCSGL